MFYTSRIDENHPVTLTFFENAKSTTPFKTVTFSGFQELADFFTNDPLVKRDKLKTIYYGRGLFEGERVKRAFKNQIVGPFLVVLDVDKSTVPLREASRRLTEVGVDHVGHTTWSHGNTKGRHSYRIVTDHVAETWDDVKSIAGQLGELADVAIDPASWNSPGFFLPSVPSERAAMLFHETAENVAESGGSSWSPKVVEVVKKETAPRGDAPAFDVDVDVDLEVVREALELIENDMDYDGWMAVGMALHSTDAEGAFELWDDWSRGSAKYAVDKDMAETWASFTLPEDGDTDAVRIGTVFHLAKEAGWIPPAPPIPTAQEDFAALSIHLNAAEEKTEVRDALVRDRGGKPADFERDKHGNILKTKRNAEIALHLMDLGLVHDRFTNTTRMDGVGVEYAAKVFPRFRDRLLWEGIDSALVSVATRRWGIEFPLTQIIHAITVHAEARQHDSLKDWFRDLEVWDGTPRLASWTTTYLGVTRTPFSDAVGRLTLVGAVARALQPGVKFDTMLILEGVQGTGKSTAIKVMGGDFTQEGLHAQKGILDRDVVDSLQGKWIIEMDELEAARKADVQAVKSFLSKTTDRARLAYARRTEDYPRRCIMIGSTNEDEYFKDDTGNRRFHPVKTGRIDLERLAEDRLQLWAEALSVWRIEGVKTITLDPALWDMAAEETEKRMIGDSWTDAIEEWMARGVPLGADFEEVGRAGPVVEATLGEVLSGALGIPVERHGVGGNSRRVSGILKRLGWEKRRIRAPRTEEGVEAPRRVRWISPSHPVRESEK